MTAKEAVSMRWHITNLQIIELSERLMRSSGAGGAPVIYIGGLLAAGMIFGIAYLAAMAIDARSKA